MEEEIQKTEKELLSVYLSSDEKAWIDEQARAEDRTSSNWARRKLLEEYKQQKQE